MARAVFLAMRHHPSTEPAPAGDLDDNRFSRDADNCPGRISTGPTQPPRTGFLKIRFSRFAANSRPIANDPISVQPDGGSAGCPRTARCAGGFRLGHAGADSDSARQPRPPVPPPVRPGASPVHRAPWPGGGMWGRPSPSARCGNPPRQDGGMSQRPQMPLPSL